MIPIEPPLKAESNIDEKYSYGKSKNKFNWELINGDAHELLCMMASNSVNCVVTSPPYYWLRDYKVDGQIGLEDELDDYIDSLVAIFRQIHRVLRSDGVVFLNIGDTYYSGKGEPKGDDKKSRKRRFGLRAVDKSGGLGKNIRPKSLIGVPWRIAIALMEDGWSIRSSIIWNRKFALPERTVDRPKRQFEYVYMLTKSRKYYYDRRPLIEANEEDVWNIIARPSDSKLSTAPFPDDLARRCIRIGCPTGGVVLDPFAGSGTTLKVALKENRNAIGIELNSDFYDHVSRVLKTL